MKVNAAGVGDVNINVAIADQRVPDQFYNHGPVTARASISSDHLLTPSAEDGERASSSTPVLPRCDQCIFFHYFSVKKRFLLLPRKIEASAGPHELPSDDESDTEGSSLALAAPESGPEYIIRQHPSSNPRVSHLSVHTRSMC